MNDNELIEYIKNVLTNFKSHVENGNVEMSLEYYNLCEELMARGINAIQENKQLKEKLGKVEKSNKEAIEFIKEKEYVIDLNTFGYELNNYEIYKLLSILDTNKGE